MSLATQNEAIAKMIEGVGDYPPSMRMMSLTQITENLQSAMIELIPVFESEDRIIPDPMRLEIRKMIDRLDFMIDHINTPR